MTYPYGTLPSGWENQVLSSIGAPVNVGNIHFLDSWEVKEHADPATGAQFNPFNTTLKEPGSYDLAGNTARVQNYPDWSTGLIATRDTIQQTNFSDIWRQLLSGSIKSGDDVFSPNFNEWSGGGYDVIHTSAFKELPSSSYTDSPDNNKPSPSLSGLSTWVIVGIAIFFLFLVIR